MQTKFNIGDKVKVLDGSEIESYMGSWAHEMTITVGEIGIINRICITDKGIGYFIKGISFLFDERGLELVTVEKPKHYSGKIIFTKGDNVFKTGHIYEIKDGRMADPRFQSKLVPSKLRVPFKDLADVKDYFTANEYRKYNLGWSRKTLEFIEVKDD